MNGKYQSIRPIENAVNPERPFDKSDQEVIEIESDMEIEDHPATNDPNLPGCSKSNNKVQVSVKVHTVSTSGQGIIDDPGYEIIETVNDHPNLHGASGQGKDGGKSNDEIQVIEMSTVSRNF